MTELFHIEHIEREERIIFKCLRLHISFYTNPKRYYYDFCKNSTVLFRLLDRILPKFNTKAAFTSYPDFSDSTFIFYDYLKTQKQNKFKEIFWLREAVDSSNDKVEDKNYYIHTLSGMWNLLTSKYIIHDHCSKFLDYISSDRHVCFNLWHGSPIKSIGCADSGLTQNTKRRYSYMSKHGYIFVSSDIYKIIFSSLFQINPNRLPITGVVRTDVIFNKKQDSHIREKFDLGGFDKVVLYAPTYKTRYSRVDVEVDFENIFGLENYSQEDFLQYLKTNNICLLIKPHPFEEKQFIKHLQDNNYDQCENIRILKFRDLIVSNININEIFNLTDLIISDFSSITIDYAILNKPILYMGNYLDKYKQCRGFILPDNYRILMPGEMVLSYEDLKEKILRCCNNGKANYKATETDILYKYKDGHSCDRIWEFVKNL